jgi:hypothetical protein
MNIEMIGSVVLGIILFGAMVGVGLRVMEWFQTRD